MSNELSSEIESALSLLTLLLDWHLDHRVLFFCDLNKEQHKNTEDLQDDVHINLEGPPYFCIGRVSDQGNRRLPGVHVEKLKQNFSPVFKP